MRMATPIIFATLGEILAERSGVLNLGIEGIMLMGAMTGFLVTFSSGSIWTGVLAAWLYAAAVLPIQTSHFATAETMTALWVALALFMALRVQVRGRWWDYGLFGIAFGAALAIAALEAGERVFVIDMDPQASLVRWFGAREENARRSLAPSSPYWSRTVRISMARSRGCIRPTLGPMIWVFPWGRLWAPWCQKDKRWEP